jgi:predicted outer membrane repeat protein
MDGDEVGDCRRRRRRRKQEGQLLPIMHCIFPNPQPSANPLNNISSREPVAQDGLWIPLLSSNLCTFGGGAIEGGQQLDLDGLDRIWGSENAGGRRMEGWGIGMI